MSKPTVVAIIYQLSLQTIRVYAAPARVNNFQPPSTDIDFSPSGHMVIIAQPLSDSLSSGSASPDTYLVDVGFGGAGPARVIPLIEGIEVKGTSHPEIHRLTRGRHPLCSIEPIEGQEDPELEWRLEHRCGTYQPDWRVLYQFSLKESYQGDRLAMAFATAGQPGIGPFWFDIMAVRYLPLEDSDDEDSLSRLIIFKNRVSRRIGDKIEKLAEFGTEIDRIQGLKQYIGITIPEENVANIRGRLAELKVEVN